MEFVGRFRETVYVCLPKTGLYSFRITLRQFLRTFSCSNFSFQLVSPPPADILMSKWNAAQITERPCSSPSTPCPPTHQRGIIPRTARNTKPMIRSAWTRPTMRRSDAKRNLFRHETLRFIILSESASNWSLRAAHTSNNKTALRAQKILLFLQDAPTLEHTGCRLRPLWFRTKHPWSTELVTAQQAL